MLCPSRILPRYTDPLDAARLRAGCPFLDEFALGAKLNGLESELFTPSGEIEEIDIGSEILPSRAQINPHSIDSLMAEVGAQRSAGTATINFLRCSSIVDGQYRATPKMTRQTCQPLSVRLQGFDALTDGAFHSKS